MRNAPTSRLLLICFCSFVLPFLLLQILDYNSETEQWTLYSSVDLRNRRQMEIIFIGGMHRSGTTLLRTMLDAHADIRCGPETAVICDVLGVREAMAKDPMIVSRLSKTDLYPGITDNAVAQFILEIIIRHAPPAIHYCNKDPLQMLFSKYLHLLFPNAKFVLMIRDGRAMAHSIISRKLQIYTYSIESYRETLSTWNKNIERMYTQCIELGETICHLVYYEQLVLQPVSTTKNLFKFLEIPWSIAVLHHEKYTNESDFSKAEASTDQVSKPLYLAGLTQWFGNIPKDVERDMIKIAPMLSVLGYNPEDKTPNYGEPDEFVKEKIEKEKKNNITS
ncbi:protein-tyrosine sulfotransferase-like [Styela clava]|uniref:protein-tyrosine sulfotransferase-like n=1 Tax=Styela clava TaxID=7725 RepID=UPI00193ACA8D|nr:protein-tyrosine sulfotransferase-like [Styela clava]